MKPDGFTQIVMVKLFTTLASTTLVDLHHLEMLPSKDKAGLEVARQRGAVLGNPNGKVALKVARAAIQARKKAFVADALKAIEEIKSTGVTKLAKLAECLNKRGEKTPRGGNWTATAVRRVLAVA